MILSFLPFIVTNSDKHPLNELRNCILKLSKPEFMFELEVKGADCKII